MALISTPSLIQQINDLLKQYHNTMWDGKGITKDNFTTDPATREANARNAFATAMGQAIETFIENTIFSVEIGSLITAGSPTTQINTNLGIITKI